MPFVLQLAHADNVCRSWSPRMIRSPDLVVCAQTRSVQASGRCTSSWIGNFWISRLRPWMCLTPRFSRIHTPTMDLAVCFAILLSTKTNTGMSAATNASRIVTDLNAVAPPAFKRVSAQLSLVLTPAVVIDRYFVYNPQAFFSRSTC